MGHPGGQTPNPTDRDDERAPRDTGAPEHEQQEAPMRPAQERPANANPVPGKDERRNRSV